MKVQELHLGLGLVERPAAQPVCSTLVTPPSKKPMGRELWDIVFQVISIFISGKLFINGSELKHITDKGKLGNCHVKLNYKVEKGSGAPELGTSYASDRNTVTQCADLCSSKINCKGFRFDPLSNDVKCKTFTDPVFSTEESSTVAVGWCPKGGVEAVK